MQSNQSEYQDQSQKHADAQTSPSSYEQTHQHSTIVSLPHSTESFCDLLFGKHHGNYYKNVFLTNPNGFNSSTPKSGIWEAYVYTSVESKRAAIKEGVRNIRNNFIRSLVNLGKHVKSTEKDALSQKILTRIYNNVTQEEQSIFDTFFNIVSKPTAYRRTAESMPIVKKEATEISTADFKTLSIEQIPLYRVNVKTLKQALDVSDAYLTNIRGQRGGKITDKLALFTLYLPLLLETDSIQVEYPSINLINDPNFQSFKNISEMEKKKAATAVRNQTGGVISNRKSVLRVFCELVYENEKIDDIPELEADVPIASAEEIASYAACHPESNTPTPISNTATLAALPSNMWRKLSDGSFQKWTADGYKPLSKEECDELMHDTCAGSNIPSKLCKEFMDAINNQDAEKILAILSKTDFDWSDNVAADSINKLHPQTVLRILKALHFGTKSTPFGKQVCSVEEWVSECIKNTTLARAGATLSPGMRKYLEYLVAFVNSNPSLIDPSKRPFATTTSATGPSEFTARGLYYVGGPIVGSSLLTFDNVQRALHAIPNTFINLNDVVMQPTMAYGGIRLQQEGQRGGNNHFYTQAATSQLSLGTGSSIKQLVKHALDGLKSTQQTIGPDEEIKINKKVDDLIKLEQEIYHKIMQVNELRLAAQSGVNCNSQLMSAQGGLMQLGSVYDRKVPCLQELCEQLRMLLAQQQNSNGCQPIE